MKRRSIVLGAMIAGVGASIVTYSLSSSASVTAQPAAAPTVEVVTAQGLDRLPSATLTDWVTYADHVAIVRFDSSRAIAPTQEELDAGEGFIPRATTFSVVRVLWSRKDAPPAPTTLELGIDGWTFEGDNKRPLRVEGQPAIDKLGTEYLMPISYLRKDETTLADFWAYLSVSSILPVADGLVAHVTSAAGEVVPAATKAVAGLPLAKVTALLNAQRPDPFAAPFASDPPTTRFNRADEARRKAAAAGQ